MAKRNWKSSEHKQIGSPGPSVMQRRALWYVRSWVTPPHPHPPDKLRMGEYGEILRLGDRFSGQAPGSKTARRVDGRKGKRRAVIDGYLMRSWKCSRCPEWILSGVITVTLGEVAGGGEDS